MDDKTQFLRDLQTRGCPVCDHLVRALDDYLAGFIAGFVDKNEVQEQYAAEGGFCPLHTWQLDQWASRRGLAKAYPKLLDRMASVLSEHARSEKPLTEVAELIKGPLTCHICELLRDEEGAYINKVTPLLAAEEVKESYAHSQGFCMIHLAAVLNHPVAAETGRFLIAQAALRFGEMARQMEIYTSKHDSLPRQTLSRDEKDVVLRAMIHLYGARRLHLQGSA
ncbi:MAG: hypothetical protein NTV58_03720 [Deltaproteobacteria bacterium]|nr:hypothetical protein [Deltaproteobacteria bacterium]